MGVFKFLLWGSPSTQFRIESLEKCVETLEGENSELREALLDLVSLMAREKCVKREIGFMGRLQELGDRIENIGA